MSKKRSINIILEPIERILRFLKCLWVLNPKRLEELIEEKQIKIDQWNVAFVEHEFIKKSQIAISINSLKIRESDPDFIVYLGSMPKPVEKMIEESFGKKIMR